LRDRASREAIEFYEAASREPETLWQFESCWWMIIPS
jgi:hypothetical protein